MITRTLLTNIKIPLSGTVYSSGVDISGLAGYCSLFLRSHDAVPTAATGTLSIFYELSNDNLNWSQVTTLSTLLTGFIKTSGPSSDGKNFLYFNPPVAAWLRIKATETGAAQAAYLTAVLGVA